jgi:hypothetical protein
MLVDFSKNLSYVTKCMHPLQVNALTSIFGSYLHPRDTKTSGSKDINQISREEHKRFTQSNYMLRKAH